MTRRLAFIAAIAAFSFAPAIASAQQSAADPTLPPLPPSTPAPPPAPPPLPPNVTVTVAAPANVVVAVGDGPNPPAAPQRDATAHREHDFDGVRLTPGWAFTQGLEDHGFFGRIEFEGFSMKHKKEFGSTSGVLCGFEAWGSRDGGGGGLPCSMWGGYRTSGGLFASLGFGWSWMIYDRVEHRGGFGILAPLGTAAIGIDAAGFRVLADVRAQYRWEWGADDRYQILGGLTLSFNDEDDVRRRQVAHR